jgi:hypothetical protein
MPPKAATDWDICASCSHTVNVHTTKGVTGECRAYLCDCAEYVKK